MRIELTHIGPDCWVSPSNLFLYNGRLLVGRSESCHLVIADNMVSRKHAKIERRGSLVIVTDLQSTNGTFVNDQRVGRCELRQGAPLKFARIEFMLKMMDTQVGFRGANNDTERCPYGPTTDHRIDHILNLMQRQLSDSEIPVLRRLVTSEAEKQIARELLLSPSTIHHHIQAIYRKLGVRSRVELLGRLIAAETGQRIVDGRTHD